MKARRCNNCGLLWPANTEVCPGCATGTLGPQIEVSDDSPQTHAGLITNQVEDPNFEAILRTEQALRDWWIDTAEQEVLAVVPKAVEYGSTDLAEIGRTMAQVMGLETDHSEHVELGIYFYVIGKMARWTDAIKGGRAVSDDTLHDLAVYVKMAQRNRAVGGWPFAAEEEDGNA